jgi:acyl carrier protein
MTRSAFCLLIDELLERDPGTTKPDETLASIPNWDSLAVIGFIALIDQHFGASVPGSKIAACVTVTDLGNLLGDKVSA